MLPDSTVRDPKKPKKKRKSTDHSGDGVSVLPSKRSKKKSETTRKKPLKRKLKKKADDEDYGSDLELSKELHPISHYMKDRRELVRQMFASLSKPKLKSMLPEILKKYSLKEMEELCCDQIEIMSKKRISALIKGIKADEISSSGTDDECSSASDDCVTIVEKIQLDPPDSTGVMVELPNIEEEIEKVKPHSIAVAMGTHSKPFNKQKLELLELEMRARAIKKMLESQQQEDPESDDEISEIASPRKELKSQSRVEVKMLHTEEIERPSTSYQSVAIDDCDDQTDNLKAKLLNDTKTLMAPATQQRLKKTKVKRPPVEGKEMEPGELSDDESADDESEGYESDDDNEINNDDAEDDEEIAHIQIEGNDSMPELEFSEQTESNNRIAESTASSGVSRNEADEIVAETSLKTNNQQSEEMRVEEVIQEERVGSDESERIAVSESSVIKTTEGQASPDDGNIHGSAAEVEMGAAEQVVDISNKERGDKNVESIDDEKYIGPVKTAQNITAAADPNQTEDCSSDSTQKKEEVTVESDRDKITDLTNPSSDIPRSEDSAKMANASQSNQINNVPETLSQPIVAEGIEDKHKCEDIFEIGNEASVQTTSSADAKPDMTTKPHIELTLIEDVNSTLYEDIPSPGMYVGQSQSDIVSQSTGSQEVASPSDRKTEAESQTHEGTTPKQAIDSENTECKTSGLNWSAGLDMNLDQLEEELIESDKDEMSPNDRICGEADDPSTSNVADPLDSIHSDRAATPEITAQRYRSRQSDESERELIRGKLSPIIVEESKSKSTSKIERKTKIYSSASTSAEQSTKLSKKSTKSSKSGKSKDIKKPRVSKSSKKLHKSKSAERSDKTKRRSNSTSEGRKEHELSIRSEVDISAVKVKGKGEQSSSDHKCSHRRSASKPKDIEQHSGKDADKKLTKDSDKKLTKDSDKMSVKDSDKASVKDSGKTSVKDSAHPKKSVFERLTKESTSQSRQSNLDRLPRQQDVDTFHEARRETVTDYRSRSPRNKLRHHSGSRHASGSPIYTRHRRDSDKGSSSYIARNETRQDHRTSQYSSHDDRPLRTYRPGRHADDQHVSPKRFRAEWEAASKIITLPSKPGVVKTYEQLPSGARKRATGSKQQPLTLADDDDDGPKSPVRFPSPDIAEVEGRQPKPAPPLVVISDSD